MFFTNIQIMGDSASRRWTCNAMSTKQMRETLRNIVHSRKMVNETLKLTFNGLMNGAKSLGWTKKDRQITKLKHNKHRFKVEKV